MPTAPCISSDPRNISYDAESDSSPGARVDPTADRQGPNERQTSVGKNGPQRVALLELAARQPRRKRRVFVARPGCPRSRVGDTAKRTSRPAPTIKSHRYNPSRYTKPIKSYTRCSLRGRAAKSRVASPPLSQSGAGRAWKVHPARRSFKSGPPPRVRAPSPPRCRLRRTLPRLARSRRAASRRSAPGAGRARLAGPRARGREKPSPARALRTHATKSHR